MKLLTINTSDISGGAAIAASRLLDGLVSYHGIENFLLVGLKYSSNPNVIWTRKNKAQLYFEFGLDILTNAVGLQYQFFPFSSRTIMRAAEDIRPDLIYLRNIHGGYFAFPLLQKLSRIAPLVWTLSDMWSFTGNCAHAFDDDSWKYLRGCRNYRTYPAIGVNTGRWLLWWKMRVYRKSDIHLVCPSRWLFDLVRQSPVFNGKEIVQIYNGFDLNVFRPRDSAICRKTLDIPRHAKVLMFCADSLVKNPWKGGRELLMALELINKSVNEKIHLLLVGAGDIWELGRFSNLAVHHVGSLQNDILMSACYSAADIFLYPTKADNLPNVLIEAAACGTPSVTVDVGGCAEIVKNGLTGLVVESHDSHGLAEKCLQLLEDRVMLERMARTARADAEKRFSLQRMSAEYYDFFVHVMNGRRKSRGV